MPVQALYLDSVYKGSYIRYVWSGDRTLLLVIECVKSAVTHAAMSYESLFSELKSFCSWQLNYNVAIGLGNELVEVLTLYHEFDYASDPAATLMLVSTPPNEYFDSQAAFIS